MTWAHYIIGLELTAVVLVIDLLIDWPRYAGHWHSPPLERNVFLACLLLRFLIWPISLPLSIVSMLYGLWADGKRMGSKSP